jgi:hypothetical protein
MRDRLATAGELLKLDQLKPQPKPPEAVSVDSDGDRYPLFPDRE